MTALGIKKKPTRPVHPSDDIEFHAAELEAKHRFGANAILRHHSELPSDGQLQRVNDELEEILWAAKMR